MNEQQVVIVVATAAKAAELNTELFEVNNGDAFQAGLVPAGSKPGTTPTHYWSSWPEHQFRYFDHLAGKVTEAQSRLRTDRTTTKIDDAGVLTFLVDDSFSPSRMLTKLGLQQWEPVDGR